MAATRRDNSWKTAGKKHWWLWTSIAVGVGVLLFLSILPLMGPGGGIGEPIREQQTHTTAEEDSIIADSNTSAFDNEASS